MWLDRFSNQSTPNANTPNRVYSPSPRKSTQLSRNGLGVGLGRTGSSTSLDLASPASSNVSLPLQQKKTAGSALRQEQRPPPDVEDPAIALRRILGLSPDEQATAINKDQDRAHTSDETANIDFEGSSLQQYLDKADGAPTSKTTDSFVRHSTAPRDGQKYENFHASIVEADEVLKSVESYLTSFKAELGQVSSEIESIQSRSVQLNGQLDNRRNVEKLLGPAVEDVSLSPLTVKAIAEGPIDDVFARSLTEVEARLLSIQGRHKESEKSKAVEDIQPLLEDLKIKAIERIRDYYVGQIKALRSPNVNAQIIQQQTFLKHKELFPFLSRNHAQLAEEIAQAYANTMRWYYHSNFTRYYNALNKLSILPSDTADLLGSDPSTSRKPATTGAKNVGAQQQQSQMDVFSLGRRSDLLKSKDDRALPSHLAEDSKSNHHLEVPFRNFNLVLLDNLTSEYAVCTELFSTNSYHQISRRVTEMFDSTFALGHQLTKSLIETSNTTDCLGILICIRLNQHLAFEAQRRKLPVMDDYTNYTNILLWPRFQKAMDQHCDSLRKYSTSATTGARGAAAAFSLVGGGGAADASRQSLAPHFITQRFGQFLHGILTLSAESGDDEPVAHSLSRLRSEYETLMGKLAKGAASDAAKRARFLFNNYSLVLTIIGDTKGKLAEDMKEVFTGLMKENKGR